MKAAVFLTACAAVSAALLAALLGGTTDGLSHPGAVTSAQRGAWISVERPVAPSERRARPLLVVRRDMDGAVVRRHRGRAQLELSVLPGRYRMESSQRRCLDRTCRRVATSQLRCTASVSLRAGDRARVVVEAGSARRCKIRVRTARGAWARLRGTVRLLEGNCQPGNADDPNPADCRTAPVSRRVLAYAPPLPANGFDDSVYTGNRVPALEGRSNTRGRYALELPPGRYSVVVVDRDDRYCGVFLGQDACLAILGAGERERYDLTIDRAAF